jgi:four helix bundle protein
MENGPSTSSGYWNGEWRMEKWRNGEMENGEWRMEKLEIKPYQRFTVMRKNIIKEKSFDFAVSVVNEMRIIIKNEKEFILTKQLIRSATSIGANIEEAGQAESKKDFIHKISIANKEAVESAYWIKLMIATDYLDANKGADLHSKCEELIRLASSILRTAKGINSKTLVQEDIVEYLC